MRFVIFLGRQHFHKLYTISDQALDIIPVDVNRHFGSFFEQLLKWVDPHIA
jgi:hypothetical protein